jgi:WD40 repeat protein
VTPGLPHDALLLCTPGDRRVMQELAKNLHDRGRKVQVVGLPAAVEGKGAGAASVLEEALKAAAMRAPLVILAVSAGLKGALETLLAAEATAHALHVSEAVAESKRPKKAKAATESRWRLIRLDAVALQGLPEGLEVMDWLCRGAQKAAGGDERRQKALVRMLQWLEVATENSLKEAAEGATSRQTTNKNDKNRDNFLKGTRDTLYRRVGGFCSRPGCPKQTTGPHSDEDKATDTGVAAHITAAARGGPRYDPSLTSTQRKSADNGIWLCQDCAKLIDSDPAAYPESLLREWKAWEEAAQLNRQLGNQPGRSDWSWAGGAWDFATFRKERREGFVRRDWLHQQVREWALNPDAAQALLIGADYGVGKTAFLAWLLDADQDGEGGMGPGLPVVAQHFCRWEANPYLSPGRFVQSLACQLKEALPAYRQAVEADQAQHRRRCLDDAETEPLLAFQQGVVEPLATIAAPATPLLIVVDALDEALGYRSTSGGGVTLTIVDLLAKEARQLPGWLRLLATSRRMQEEIVKPLRAGFFKIDEINAESNDNLDDIYIYVKNRCQQLPLAEKLHGAGLLASDVAEVARAKSGGKFLYAVCVLNDVANGALPIRSRQSLDELPPGMDGFYRQTFERRYAEERSYAEVKPILGLLCAQLEPLTYHAIAAILKSSPLSVSRALKPLNDLLHLLPVPDAEGGERGDRRCSFAHLSLEQWLSQEKPDDLEHWAGRFAADRAAAEEQIRAWALAEVAAHRAHTWPYLVRHLASHLSAAERPEVIAGLLRQFPWLQARLRLAGLNALLGDFEPSTDPPASLPPELVRLGRALRQAAHVLSHQQDWNGQDQLASQLLARLGDNGELAGLREQATQWLHKAGGAAPLAASLLSQQTLVRTLAVGNVVCSKVGLPDGRLVCGCSDGTIHLLDLASGACSAVLEGHRGGVWALAVLDDGRLASGSDDYTIRLWDPCRPQDEACCAVFEGHRDWVRALAVLRDGLLASGSRDNTIRIWDPRRPQDEACCAVFQGHGDLVSALAVLRDGRFASGSRDNTIRIWDPRRPQDEACCAVFEGHRDWVRALAVLDDGRLASGSDDYTIRLWDPHRPQQEACCAVFEGHRRDVNALAVLDDGRFASGSDDTTIRLWDPQCPPEKACQAVFEGDGNSVVALVVLRDGLLASSSLKSTIRIWAPDRAPAEASSAILEGHRGAVCALAVLGDDRLASGADDKTIRIWDLQRPPAEACSAVLKGHRGAVCALAVLGDGRLASGSDDATIRIWNPNGSSAEGCLKVMEGHQFGVRALAVLDDGRLASGSVDYTIRIWDLESTSAMAGGAVIGAHWPGVNALAKLGDGCLVSISGDTTIGIWDPNRSPGKASRVVHYLVHRDGIIALAVMGDGRLAFALADATICIWNPVDPHAEACRTLFQGHRSEVSALAVLGDGRLASGSFDNTIRLWDTATPTGSPQLLFVADAAITALAWLPTHQLLVAGDASGRLHWLALPLSPR